LPIPLRENFARKKPAISCDQEIGNADWLGVKNEDVCQIIDIAQTNFQKEKLPLCRHRLDPTPDV